MPKKFAEDDMLSEATQSERGTGDEALLDEANEALKQHLLSVQKELMKLEKTSTAQPDALEQFFNFLREMNLPTDDLIDLRANFSIANGVWMKDKTGQSFASHLAETLTTQMAKIALLPGTDAEIPYLEEAPQRFGGVSVDGNPYKFLLKHYGPWLQEGRKCLDRPLLDGLDPKLLKALQQRYTRGADPDMPPLSEIFAGKVEAARNRSTYMQTKNNDPR